MLTTTTLHIVATVARWRRHFGFSLHFLQHPVSSSAVDLLCLLLL